MSDQEEANSFINDVFGRLTAMAALRCTIQLGILNYLPKSNSISLKELASRARAPEETIRRLLLPLSAMGVIANPAPSQYSHTSLSSAFCDANVQNYFTFGWDHIMPSFNQLHEWLEKNAWQEPQSTRNCAFAMTHGGAGLFEYMDNNPAVAANFNMMIEHMQFPASEIFPFENVGIDWTQPDSIVVDVGGGKGQACSAIVQEHPILQGRIILQDKADVLSQVPSEVRKIAKTMPHDFFQRQPVRGAAIYHIRRILCDWPDRECEVILTQQAKAMSQASRVLVAGLIVPQYSCDPLTEGMDLSTLVYAGKERTLENYAALFTAAGLRIVKVWKHKEAPVSIIEGRLLKEEKL